MSENRIFGLLEKDINSIVSIISSNTKVESIIIFGSRAKGNNKAGSDIDVAVKGNSIGLDDILNARMRFEQLSLPYKIDLVIYDRVKEEELISHIDRAGIIIFQR